MRQDHARAVKHGGLEDLDNIPADEHPRVAQIVGIADDGNYLDHDRLLELMLKEVAGSAQPVGRTQAGSWSRTMPDATFSSPVPPGQKDIVVLVIGEASRARNYAFYGYSRDTNPFTKPLGSGVFSSVPVHGYVERHRIYANTLGGRQQPLGLERGRNTDPDQSGPRALRRDGEPTGRPSCRGMKRTA